MICLRSALCACLSAAAAIFTALGAQANSEPTYRSLRDAALSESATVENVVIHRDNAVIALKSGSLAFTPKVMGRDTRAVFTGQGEFSFAPVSPLEKLRLLQVTSNAAAHETFDRALFCFTDRSGEELRQQIKTSASVDPQLAGVLKEYRKLLRSRTDMPRSLVQSLLTSEAMDNVEADLLADLYNPNQPGFFSAYMHGHKYGDLRFHVKPRGALAELPAPEEVALINVDTGGMQEGIWVLEHLKSEIEKGTANSDEDKRTAQANAYRIETAIGKSEQFDATAELRFQAVTAGDRVVKLGLVPSLRVSAVTSGGKEIPWVQEDRREDPTFYVILPEPMERGSERTIAIEYAGGKGAEGDRVLSKAGGGNFSVGARESWYPSLNSFRDHSKYNLIFRSPKQYTLVSVGNAGKHSVEDGANVTEWTTDAPIAVAGFNMGQFKRKDVTDSQLGMKIEGYATSDAPDYLREMEGDATGLMSPSRLLDQAMAEAQNALRIFSAYFGKSEYGRIAITQQPEFNFGQSWPSLVYLPMSAFLDSTQRMRLLGIQNRLTEFVDEVTPHEVSHQWWGHMVGWKTYHDQWLSEGFAEFSAGLYLQLTEKNPSKYLAYWDHARHALVDKNNYGQRANDAGPVWLGLLLSNSKNSSAYTNVVYRKGGYILHMLRSMMWDAKQFDKPFIAMMQDYVEQRRDGNASTESFQRVVEKHMNKGMDLDGNGKMDWFFRQWVYGTTLPHYQFDYKLDPGADGRCLVTASLTQSDVPPDFRMIVPLYVDFDGSPIRIGQVRLVGNTTIDKIQVRFPKTPKRVMINAMHDVLEQ